MVIELQDCHHGRTAFAAMTSVRHDGSSDVTSAYERAMARDENAVIPNQLIAGVEPRVSQAIAEP